MRRSGYSRRDDAPQCPQKLDTHDARYARGTRHAQDTGNAHSSRRTRNTRRTRLLTLSLGSLLISGCASAPNVIETPPQKPPQTAQSGVGRAYQESAGTQCPDTSTDPAVQKLRQITSETTLPADFHGVAVVRCRLDQETVPGNGVWQVAIAQRAETDLSGFIALLRKPDETSTPQNAPTGVPFACAASMLLIPAFGLVGSDGAVLSPRLPQTICGDPLPEILTALDALPWKTEAKVRTTQLQTQTEIDTGCPSAYKYLPGLGISSDATPWSQVRHPPTPTSNVLCIYHIAMDGGSVPVGSFAGGAKLTKQQGTALDQAVGSASTPDAAAHGCSAQATRFALVGTKDNLATLVELNGCRRVMFPDNYLGTPTPALFQLLASFGAQ